MLKYVEGADDLRSLGSSKPQGLVGEGRRAKKWKFFSEWVAVSWFSYWMLLDAFDHVRKTSCKQNLLRLGGCGVDP